MGVPARTTYADWLAIRPHIEGPIAATSDECDAIWDWLYVPRRGPRWGRHLPWLFGQRVVEIDDWPEWMP